VVLRVNQAQPSHRSALAFVGGGGGRLGLRSRRLESMTTDTGGAAAAAPAKALRRRLVSAQLGLDHLGRGLRLGRARLGHLARLGCSHKPRGLGDDDVSALACLSLGLLHSRAGLGRRSARVLVGEAFET